MKLPALDRYATFAIAGIAVLTLLVYARGIGGDFTNWDDPNLVQENPAIRSLAPGAVIDMFTPRAGESYQPLRVFSYAIDYKLWGLRPAGYHAMNILLHALAACLLFLALRSALPKLRTPHKLAPHAALLGALLWALHPVNVESVAWIASRKYVLLGNFAFLAWLAFSDGRRWTAYSATLCAILSSPFGIALPPLLVLYDYCCSEQRDPRAFVRESWRHHLALLVILAILLPILWWVLVVGDARGERTAVEGVGLWSTGLTMLRVLVDYARNLILPLWLNAKYVNHIDGLGSPKVWLGLLGLCGIGWACWRAWKKDDKLPLFMAAWFFIAWAPVSNIVPISTTMADRYLYLPIVGLCAGFALLLGRWPRSGGVSVAIFAILAFLRVGVWQNSETLWSDSLAKDESNAVAHCNLGRALEKRQAKQEAIECYLRAIQLDPNEPGIHSNIGHLLNTDGRYHEAIPHLQRALALNADFTPGLINMGNALSEIGRAAEALPYLKKAVAMQDSGANRLSYGTGLLRAGQHQAAIAEFQAAIQRSPQLTEAHNNVGVALINLKRHDEAIPWFESALAVDPGYVVAVHNIANAHHAMGRHQQAVAQYQKALQLDPGYAPALGAMATALQAMGRVPEAIALCRQAVDRQPGSAELWFQLALVQSKTPDTVPEAVKAYQRVIAIQPSARAHNNLGTLLLNAGQVGPAIVQFEAALRLAPSYARAHNNLGNAYSKTEQGQRAEQHYQSAIKLAPSYISPYYNLGLLYLNARRFAESASAFREVLKRDPNHAAAKSNLAICQQALKQ
jgi:tetratricopeptide (TPR) repeat protein